jgi:hypothetical protein
MKRIVRLTERDLTRLVKRVIKEEMGSGCKYPERCVVEIRDEDGTKRDRKDENSINIANQIAKACDCFSNSYFSNWDEIAFVSTIEKIKDKKTFDTVNGIVSCWYFEAANIQTGEHTDLKYLANKMMGSWESDLKSRASRVFSKFK